MNASGPGSEDLRISNHYPAICSSTPSTSSSMNFPCNSNSSYSFSTTGLPVNTKDDSTMSTSSATSSNNNLDTNLGASASISSPTFHLLPQLPPELQLKIWKFAAEPEPRDVKLQVVKTTAGSVKTYLKALTPTPAILHVCHDARKAGLLVYTKSFKQKDKHGDLVDMIYTVPRLDVMAIKFPDRSSIAKPTLTFTQQFESFNTSRGVIFIYGEAKVDRPCDSNSIYVVFPPRPLDIHIPHSSYHDILHRQLDPKQLDYVEILAVSNWNEVCIGSSRPIRPCPSVAMILEILEHLDRQRVLDLHVEGAVL